MPDPSTAVEARPRPGLRRRVRDLRVGKKVGLAVGVCLLLMVAQGINDVVRVSELAHRSAAMYRQSVEGEAALGDARSAINRMRQRVLLHVLAGPEQKAGRQREIDELDAAFDEAVDRLRPTGAVPAAELDPWVAAVATYREFRDRTILPSSVRGVTPTELAQILADCDRLFLPIEKDGLDLSAAAVGRAAVEQAHADASAVRTRNTIVGLLALGLLVGIALAYVATRLIVRPLVEVRRVLDAVADGDLTQTADVDSTDEPGQMAASLGRATASVRRTVRSLADSARSLSGASEELSTNSTQIADAAQRTANETHVARDAVQAIGASVQSIAAGADQMSASIREISLNASEAAVVASRAVSAAHGANAQVAKLGESSAEIGNVVSVITSIAEQTNLLALNATIEAARAGESGKGFAVVAGEVKQLAQETARATHDISQRVAAIQADTAGAVAAIAEIAEIVDRINDYQSTIASAVEEQTATTNEMSQSIAVVADGSSQVNDNIAGVASAASTTTEGVGEASRAAQELAQMSAQLQELVDQFRY